MRPEANIKFLQNCSLHCKIIQNQIFFALLDHFANEWYELKIILIFISQAYFHILIWTKELWMHSKSSLQTVLLGCLLSSWNLIWPMCPTSQPSYVVSWRPTDKNPEVPTRSPMLLVSHFHNIVLIFSVLPVVRKYLKFWKMPF